MSEKKIPVITINRQYAAYGRTIAAKVSEKLGIPYYDKDFVKKTVAESGYDLDAILKDGEDIGYYVQEQVRERDYEYCCRKLSGLRQEDL